jgi:hypothetical protein
MTDRGGIPADLSNLVGKVYNLCRVKTYSNSRVLGHGRLEWSLSSPMSVLFSKDVIGRKRRKVSDGVLGGYCHDTREIRVLVGYCRGRRMVMFD